MKVSTQPSRKIVLTGAPGSGKTTITRLLAEMSPHRFVLVPEAATQTYTALKTRWDKLDERGRRDAQLQIYALQVRQEREAAADIGSKLLLLDRGTIDGAAYWPDGPGAYWNTLGSTHDAELERYDLVLLLESAAALGQYDGDASNDVRFETAQQSLENGKLLEYLWGSHPHLIRISATVELREKIIAVESAIDAATSS